ncbi:MAG: hypothetical protein AAGE76_07255 [Pseudomonadota bacterium]
MKTRVHRTALSAAWPFDLDAVKVHLRADADDEDEAIQVIGKTAAAELEQFAQIALLRQTVRVTIFIPDPDHILTLPIGPVQDGHCKPG